MSYCGPFYQRRPHTYKEEDIQVIGAKAYEAIVRAFFDLDEGAVAKLLADYTERYGEGRGDYARRTYPLWKSGEKKLSGELTGRMLDLVPRQLSTEERIAIFRMILDADEEKRRGRRPREYFRLTLEEACDPVAILKQVYERINVSLAKASDPGVMLELSDPVKEKLSWVLDADMETVRKLIEQFHREEATSMALSAKESVNTFIDAISAPGVETATTTVSLPDVDLQIEFDNQPIKKKSFLARLFGWF